MKSFTFIFFGALFLGVCLLTVAGCRQQRSSSNSNESPQEARGRETPAQTPDPSDATAAITHEQYDFTNVDRMLERAAPRLGGGALLFIKDGEIVFRETFCRDA